MNLTLHLTEDCNMACSYCPDKKTSACMSKEVAKAACRLAFSSGKKAGICFFGGEPLLKKELIYLCLDYCTELSKETGKPVEYSITTNGTLLDEQLLLRLKKEKLRFGVSFDGTAQDICRRYKDGGETFDTLSEKTRLLLTHIPSAYAMMTVAPEALPYYADAVRSLYGHGFYRITATIAYGKNVSWDDEALAALKKQLLLISKLYEDMFISGKRFYFSPFDAKISECISGYDPSERCHLGQRQLPVSVDGRIYPCTRFIGDSEYLLGNVYDGIDEKKRAELALRDATPKECLECKLRSRCTNSCGCMNRLETGDENKVSPLQCEYERMLIGIADGLAERLMNEHSDRFIKKYAR